MVIIHHISIRMCDSDLQILKPDQLINSTALADSSANDSHDHGIKLILEKVLKNPKLKEINYNSKQNIINISPWREVIEILDLLTEGKVTVDTDNSDQKLIINIIAKRFAEQLKLDQIELSRNQPVSECALLCPSWDTKYDKLFGICSDISLILFPKTDDSLQSHDHEMEIYNKFSKTLSRLRNAYREQAKAYEKEEVAFRSVLCSNKREKFAELKALPISHNILKPTASTSVRYILDSGATLDPLIHHIRYCQDKHEDKVFDRGSIFSNNEKLDVSFQGLDTQMLENLFDAVRTNNSIQHILLGNNPIGDTGAEIIGKFIRENRIKTWYICACDITADGIQMICDALNAVQHNAQQGSKKNMIESLWLKRNPLTPQGVRHIAEMICTNDSIKILDLSSTGMLDEGCGYLFDRLKHNRTLESLYIGCNGITIEGARSIAEYFNHLSQHNLRGIVNLYIDVNRLDDHGTEIICDAITPVNHIKRISFGSNRMSHLGAKKIFDTFVESKELIFLDIGTCKSTPKVRELPNDIGDRGVDWIVEFLKMNRSVQLLNMRHIGLTPTGLGVLDMAFKNDLDNNTSLLKLFLEQAGVNKQAVMNSLTDCLTTITDRNLTLYCNLREYNDQYDKQFLKDLCHDMSLTICHHELTKNVVSQYVKQE